MQENNFEKAYKAIILILLDEKSNDLLFWCNLVRSESLSSVQKYEIAKLVNDKHVWVAAFKHVQISDLSIEKRVGLLEGFFRFNRLKTLRNKGII